MIVSINTNLKNEELAKLEFQEIIEKNKGILYKVSRTYCPFEEDREDLIQDMMISIWKSLEKFDRSYKLSTWLYRICLNTAISHYRKHSPKKQSSISLTGEEENIESCHNDLSDERNEQLNLLEKFISELNDIDKALMMLYLEDKSHAEISQIMGISVSNAGTKIGRIKDKLKLKFKNFEKDLS